MSRFAGFRAEALTGLLILWVAVAIKGLLILWVAEAAKAFGGRT